MRVELDLIDRSRDGALRPTRASQSPACMLWISTGYLAARPRILLSIWAPPWTPATRSQIQATGLRATVDPIGHQLDRPQNPAHTPLMFKGGESQRMCSKKRMSRREMSDDTRPQMEKIPEQPPALRHRHHTPWGDGARRTMSAPQPQVA